MKHSVTVWNFEMEDLCKVCGVSVQRKNSARHAQLHSDKVLKCEICDKAFQVKGYLSAHMKTHRPPEDINCTLCKKVLHSSSALRKHMLTFHYSLQYSCPYCSKNFTQKAYSINHIEHCKKAIPVKESISCEICFKTFQTRKKMLDHRSHMHRNLKDRYCRFCKKNSFN